ncbi:uncharacterized protein G2W53_000787 [Senna tora]|uniref:Uncharacterized protein n=1 Tax=Senna tora TaxID=362788 RepID=A0A834XEZ9_9FABA|nr:uncharacterized protein G2W53_000787 [Senna tora]
MELTRCHKGDELADESLASSSSANPLSPFTGVCSPASLENRYANMVASISQVLYSK